MRRQRLARALRLVLLALLVQPLAGCEDRSDGPVLGPPFAGRWVDYGNPDHLLLVDTFVLVGEADGRVAGREVFEPDGPVNPFAGPFIGAEMFVTIERPDGPEAFVGQLLETELMLLSSEDGYAYLFIRPTLSTPGPP